MAMEFNYFNKPPVNETISFEIIDFEKEDVIVSSDYVLMKKEKYDKMVDNLNKIKLRVRDLKSVTEDIEYLSNNK